MICLLFLFVQRVQSNLYGMMHDTISLNSLPKAYALSKAKIPIRFSARLAPTDAEFLVLRASVMTMGSSAPSTCDLRVCTGKSPSCFIVTSLTPADDLLIGDLAAFSVSWGREGGNATFSVQVESTTEDNGEFCFVAVSLGTVVDSNTTSSGTPSSISSPDMLPGFSVSSLSAATNNTRIEPCNTVSRNAVVAITGPRNALVPFKGLERLFAKRARDDLSCTPGVGQQADMLTAEEYQTCVVNETAEIIFGTMRGAANYNRFIAFLTPPMSFDGTPYGVIPGRGNQAFTLSALQSHFAQRLQAQFHRFPFGAPTTFEYARENDDLHFRINLGTLTSTFFVGDCVVVAVASDAPTPFCSMCQFNTLQSQLNGTTVHKQVWSYQYPVKHDQDVVEVRVPHVNTCKLAGSAAKWGITYFIHYRSPMGTWAWNSILVPDWTRPVPLSTVRSTSTRKLHHVGDRTRAGWIPPATAQIPAPIDDGGMPLSWLLISIAGAFLLLGACFAYQHPTSRAWLGLEVSPYSMLDEDMSRSQPLSNLFDELDE